MATSPPSQSTPALLQFKKNKDKSSRGLIKLVKSDLLRIKDDVQYISGVHIFHFATPPPPRLGKKYDGLLRVRKHANIRGKRWKNGGKRGIFIVLWGKNVSLEKKGGGTKISNFGIN